MSAQTQLPAEGNQWNLSVREDAGDVLVRRVPPDARTLSGEFSSILFPFNSNQTRFEQKAMGDIRLEWPLLYFCEVKQFRTQNNFSVTLASAFTSASISVGAPTSRCS